MLSKTGNTWLCLLVTILLSILCILLVQSMLNSRLSSGEIGVNKHWQILFSDTRELYVLKLSDLSLEAISNLPVTDSKVYPAVSANQKYISWVEFYIPDTLVLYEYQTGVFLRNIYHGGIIKNLSWANQSSNLAFTVTEEGSTTGSILLYSVEAGDLKILASDIAFFDRSGNSSFTPLSWSPNDDLVLFNGIDQKIGMLNVYTGSVDWLITGEDPIWITNDSIAYKKNGYYFMYNLTSGQNGRMFEISPNATSGIFWSPDKKYAVFTSVHFSIIPPFEQHNIEMHDTLTGEISILHKNAPITNFYSWVTFP